MSNSTKLLEVLRTVDELSLLELLEITSDELVDAFTDKIEDREQKLWRYIDDQETEE